MSDDKISAADWALCAREHHGDPALGAFIEALEAENARLRSEHDQFCATLWHNLDKMERQVDGLTKIAEKIAAGSRA